MRISHRHRLRQAVPRRGRNVKGARKRWNTARPQGCSEQRLTTAVVLRVLRSVRRCCLVARARSACTISSQRLSPSCYSPHAVVHFHVPVPIILNAYPADSHNGFAAVRRIAVNPTGRQYAVILAATRARSDCAAALTRPFRNAAHAR